VEVIRTQRLSATMIRVVFSGPDLERFSGSVFTDSYVKLMFPTPGVAYPQPLDMERVRAELPAGDWPVVRTYSVRAWQPETLELTIDFVVHGDAGVAGPWAAAAKPGDRIFLQGPGGAYAPDPAADWHLLAGDESALPAISAAVEALSITAAGHVLIEVHGPESEIDLQVPAGVTLTWVHTGDAPFGRRLVDAVGALDLSDGDGQVFVHGEAGFVAELRRLLRVERGLPRHRLSISGYWRIGADEEGWRAAKAAWNAAAEELEQRAGVS
jgi:NADPH-dependent ferric siderophore reductase